MIVMALVALFVVGGSIGAAALWFVFGHDSGTTTTTTTSIPPPPPSSGPAIVTGTMRPMDPTPSVVPPATTGGTPSTPPPSSTVATAGVDAGTGAASPEHEHHVSPADEARARAESARGLAAIDNHDWGLAITSLRECQRLVGRSGSAARQLQTQLDTRGGNQVGILLQQGHCPNAQALYRDLRGVGAGTAARRQFSDDWCPAPH
jgi:hypothetical protein